MLYFDRHQNHIDMKPLCLSLFFCCALFFSAPAQTLNTAQNLKMDAQKMAKAFLAGDYKNFAKYTYPRILAAMGGESRMAATLSKSVDGMGARGMSLDGITFGEPSKIVKNGKELQATITQHTGIKQAVGTSINTSILIAISMDNGSSWTFIDTQNKDMAALRKALPNLSPAITIPR